MAIPARPRPRPAPGRAWRPALRPLRATYLRWRPEWRGIAKLHRDLGESGFPVEVEVAPRGAPAIDGPIPGDAPRIRLAVVPRDLPWPALVVTIGPDSVVVWASDGTGVPAALFARVRRLVGDLRDPVEAPA